FSVSMVTRAPGTTCTCDGVWSPLSGIDRVNLIVASGSAKSTIPSTTRYSVVDSTTGGLNGSTQLTATYNTKHNMMNSVLLIRQNLKLYVIVGTGCAKIDSLYPLISPFSDLKNTEYAFFLPVRL